MISYERSAMPSLSLNIVGLQDWLVPLLARAVTHGEATQSSFDLSNILILKQKEMAVRIAKELRWKYATS